ncbi:MAG: energy transducer TonB [Pyrinomonadaceae bacterium]|nr:energy transducer TonB [Pyrinomonadaceae bacterium]
MPQKAIKFLISFVFITSISFVSLAQTTTSAADVMKERISKAKAYLVIKNYSAGIYELENIRRETGDRTIQRAINVLLMHAYLEQGDYIKAQNFLKKLFKSKIPTATMDYLAVAGQVVSGANTQLKRYQSLGLSVSDSTLPNYATADIEEMRKTLELVAKHSKVLSKNKAYSANSMALLEETGNARSNIAKDDYDAKRWKNEVVYARQQLASSGSKVINAVNDKPINAPDPNIVATSDVKTDPVETEEIVIPKSETIAAVGETSEEANPTLPVEISEKPEIKEKTPEKKIEKPKETEDQKPPKKRAIKIIKSAKEELGTITAATRTVEKGNKSIKKPAVKKVGPAPRTESNIAVTEQSNLGDGSPVAVGALTSYATKRVNPIYPRQAKNMRMTGIVKVELVIDEEGKVAKVETTSGPSLLKGAARSAIKRWKFKPFKRDGQPVKATGFVSFNFSL